VKGGLEQAIEWIDDCNNELALAFNLNEMQNKGLAKFGLHAPETSACSASLKGMDILKTYQRKALQLRPKKSLKYKMIL
jgi:hypothetical protein